MQKMFYFFCTIKQKILETFLLECSTLCLVVFCCLALHSTVHVFGNTFCLSPMPNYALCYIQAGVLHQIKIFRFKTFSTKL